MFKFFKKNRKVKKVKKMYKVTLLNLYTDEIEETITDEAGLTGIAIGASGAFDIVKTEEI